MAPEHIDMDNPVNVVLFWLLAIFIWGGVACIVLRAAIDGIERLREPQHVRKASRS